ncbi:MAG: NAD(P)-dependent oxidoreductase [Sphingomonadaceae bacterium]|nr:NAD(P)-dependent oxidoreductase [Sphingomonadaceae bacterium]
MEQTTPDAARIIGLAGIGNIGLPIALNLIDGGFTVVGYRRTPEPEFAAAGGQPVSNAAAIANQTNIAITCLPSVEALQMVISGPDGLLSGAFGAGGILIEMSTLDVEEKAKVAALLRAHGIAMLDCPVAASGAMLRQRKGMVFVSGEPADAEAVGPILDAIIDTHVYVGPFGAGTRTKLVSNLLLAIHSAAAAEAMNFARLLGLDLQTTAEVIGRGSGGSVQWDMRAKRMASGDHDQSIGPISALLEVTRLIESAGEQQQAARPMFNHAHQLLKTAEAEGKTDMDISWIYEVIRKSGG